MMKRYSSEVWLLVGFINSLPGILTLEKGRIILTAIGSGTFWERGLKKLEAKTTVKDLPGLLKQGKPVQLFNVQLKDVQKIVFPGIYFSTAAHITIKNQKYRLSFIQPNNTKVFDKSDFEAVESIQDIFQSRKVGKIWRSILVT